MRLLTPRLDFETALQAELKDARATITLLLASVILSARHLLGTDYGFLVAEIDDLPGRPWTLVTTTLLHGGWLHLAFNAYWTAKFGALLEALFGTLGFALILIGLAVGSSAAQLALSGPGIGLSGIVYGLFGIAWALARWHPRCRGLVDKRITELFAVWFVICVVATWFDVLRIGNVAHGSGFVFGALGGWALAGRARAERLRRGAALAAVALLIPLLFLAPVRHVLNRSRAYSFEIFERGYAALEDEDWEAAARAYEDFVAREPDMPEGWNNLAIAYRRLGRTAEARDALERAQELERAPRGE